MTQSVRTIPGEMTASAVARLFAENDIGAAIVVDPETGDTRGIVTESDIMQQVATDADVTAVQVSSFMTSPVITISSTESIHTAATLMKDHSIRRLPVVDAGSLVGILTTTHLTYSLSRLRTGLLRT